MIYVPSFGVVIWVHLRYMAWTTIWPKVVWWERIPKLCNASVFSKLGAVGEYMDLVLARLHTINNNNTSFITCIYSSPPAPVTSSLSPLATTTKVKSSKLTDKKKQSPLLLALYFFQLEAHRLGISSDNDTSLPVCNSEVRLGLPAYIWKAMPVVCSKGYVYVANHS